MSGLFPSAAVLTKKCAISDVLQQQAAQLARLTMGIQIGLDSAKSAIPGIDALLAELTTVGVTEFHIEGRVVYRHPAGSSAAYDDSFGIYQAAIIKPGGIGCVSWVAANYHEHTTPPRGEPVSSAPWATPFRSRRATGIRAADTTTTKNTPAKQTAPPRAASKPLPIGRADRPDRDARRGVACVPHRPIVKHLANHPKPDGYTWQVGATPGVGSLMRQHLRNSPEKSTGLCPYPFPFQIWFDGDAVRARSASRRKGGGS